MKYIVWGFFAAVCMAILFVQAPKLGGVSGGAQVSQIVKAAGSSLSSVTSSIETGSYNGVT